MICDRGFLLGTGEAKEVVGLLLEGRRPRSASERLPGGDRGNEGVWVSVARSARRVRKLWTGRPSSVRPVVCLVTAAGERSALATTLERSASAASLSVSS